MLHKPPAPLRVLPSTHAPHPCQSPAARSNRDERPKLLAELHSRYAVLVEKGL